MRKAGIKIAFALAVFAASGCATTSSRPAEDTTRLVAEKELVVALYPYVPRIHQFQTAIEAEWKKVQPDVSLHFLSAQEWDGGYSMDPPSTADVYVFDAMFFELFRSKGFLEPMAAGEVQHLRDFVEYAIEGVKIDDRYYAIPQLGCANILFYQRNDEPLTEATTLREVEAALKQCTYTSEIPPDRRGLMIDMAGGTTNASLYLDTVHSLTGAYPPPLPWDHSELNREAMNNMRRLLAMASYANGTDSKGEAYTRGTWFSDGWGRALVGYTEAMSAMSAETRHNISFKVMPLSHKGDASPMFYADVIAVNTTTRERGTRALAVQLANVMAAKDTMVNSIGPGDGQDYPQYLMATRPSVFETLSQKFPIYKKMFALLTGRKPVMFIINDQSRAWLDAMKNTIRSDARKDYPCGCDYQASELISDPAAAPAICKATCEDHGGWNGQWTNAFPAAPEGKSACGCKTCPP